jgi:hypothetical protein
MYSYREREKVIIYRIVLIHYLCHDDSIRANLQSRVNSFEIRACGTQLLFTLRFYLRQELKYAHVEATLLWFQKLYLADDGFGHDNPMTL